MPIAPAVQMSATVSFIAAPSMSAEKSLPDCLANAPGHRAGSTVWQLPIEPQGRGGRRRSPQRGAALRSLRSGHGSARWKSRSRWMGKCAEFIRERREVGAGAPGPVSGPWGVRYGMIGVSAAHRCF